MDIKCLDCGADGLAKTSKAGKIYYQCPTCPGTDPKYKKFLTFLDEAHNYGKEKGGKRKVPLTDAQSYAAGAKKGEKVAKRQKTDEYEIMNAKIDRLMANVDQILKKVESLLESEHPQEQESGEEEGSE